MKYFLLALFLLAFIAPVFSQMLPPDPDIQVPVDGGISLVVGGSIMYGIYRSRNKK